jgi:hypothetical protein
MKMVYRILQNGKAVGYFTITKETEVNRSDCFQGVISLKSREELVPTWFRDYQSIKEVKDEFKHQHGGEGYELEEPGASL